MVEKKISNKEKAKASSSKVVAPKPNTSEAKRNTKPHPSKNKNKPKTPTPSPSLLSKNEYAMEDEVVHEYSSTDLTPHKFVNSQGDESSGPTRTPSPKAKRPRKESKTTDPPPSRASASKQDQAEQETTRDVEDEVDPTQRWDVLHYNNFCNRGEEFVVPDTFEDSFPLMGKKGGPAFYHDGFIFKCNDGNKIRLNNHHYICEGKGCDAKLTTSGFGNFIKQTKEHSCLEVDNVINRLLKWYVIQRHPYNQKMKAPEVATLALKNLTPMQKNTCCTQGELTQFIRDHRTTMSQIGVSPTTITELEVAEKLRLTLKKQQFLLHDDGIGANDRVLMFSTQENLRRLMEADTWLVDATFSTCPRIFDQLWTIHAQFGDIVLPMAHFLMAGRTTEEYAHCLRILREKLDQIPGYPKQTPPPLTQVSNSQSKATQSSQATTSTTKEKTKIPLSYPYHSALLVDFEGAQGKAFEQVFHSIPQGCFFHYRQALRKNLHKCKDLNKLINKDGSKELLNVFNQFSALALIPSAEMNLGLDVLVEQPLVVTNGAAFAPFIKYYKSQWSGELKISRRTGQKNKINYNCYKQLKDGTLKTTSSVEGWHSQFKQLVGGDKPKFNHLIVALQKQEEKTNQLYDEYLAKRRTPSKKKNKVTKFDTVTAMALAQRNKNNYLPHLKGIASALMLA